MKGVEISRGLVALNTTASVLTQFVNAAVFIWVNQYLLKQLDPEEYAPYPVVVAFVLFLQVFTAGLTGGIARYVTEAYAQKDLRRVTEIVSSMMPVVVGGALIFLFVGGLASWNVDVLLTIHPDQIDNARLMMAILVAGHAVVLVATPLSVGVHVRQQFVWLNGIRLGQQILTMLLLFVLLFGLSANVLWVVIASVASLIASASVTLVLSRRLVPELRFERRAFDRATARLLSTFGAWTMLGNFLYRVRTSADVIILNKFSTAVDVNSFHIGTIPDRQVDAFVGTGSVPMQPALTAMHATRQPDSLRRAYVRGNRYFLWITLAVATPLIIFSRELVTLYVGEEYILAATVVMLISFRYPFTYATEMLYQVALAQARVQTYFLTVTISVFFRIGLTVLLVAHFGLGALGAASVALALAALVQVFVLWPMGLHMVELPLRSYFRETLLPGYLPALVAAAACLVVRTWIPALSWSTLFLDVAIGLAVYFLVMYLSFRPEDKRDFSLLWDKTVGLLKRNPRSSSPSDP